MKKNADSLAAPADAGQGTSEKRSSQLSIGSQGPNGRQSGQLEQFTRVGKLGKLAQLRWSPATACASEDCENNSGHRSSGSSE